jgi:uncharacterized protein YybS (DUF2232 family)
LLRNRLIFLFSTLQLYSQGGMVIVLTLSLIINLLIITIHRWQRGVFGVSNPISYPHFRFWASIINGKKLSPLIFYLVFKDIRPTLSIILYILYLILAFILYLFYLLKFINLKPPTNPLRLIKTINVRVSGLTESSGTRFGRH